MTSRFPIIPVARSLLSAEALLAYVKAHYAVEAIGCEPHLQGLNDTYIIYAVAERFVLRVYAHGWRTDDNVAFELELLDHLQRAGASSAAPVRTSDGALFTLIEAPEGLRQVALFEYVPGIDMLYNEVTADWCRSYGESAGKLHTAMDTYKPAHQRFVLDMRHLVDEPQVPLKPRLAHRPDDWQTVAMAADDLRAAVFRLETKGLSHSLCHGDLHSHNARGQDDGSVRIFDFDCCGYGWRAYDLAVFRWSLSLAGTLPNEEELWAAFLEGYRMQHELLRLDEAAIPVFAAIRQIWLLGLHAQLGATMGGSFMSDSYYDRQLAILRRWTEAATSVDLDSL